jgi:hypothetical protein
MNKLSSLILILAVVVVIIGAIWVLGARQSSQTAPTAVLTTPVPTPTATVTPVPAEVPVTLEAETINLTDVTGGNSSGEATRKFSDGKFTHSVTASLPEPEDSAFYEGWLVKADDAGFFSTGKMTKSGTEYQLNYTDTVDHPDFPTVVITLEKIDDTEPETHVLEGTFAEQLFL